MDSKYDSGKIEFANVSVVITDPCYLTRKIKDGFDSVTDWDLCNYGEHMDKLGFTTFKTFRNGVGDGAWKVFDSKSGKKLGEIWADSGLTGIYLLNDITNYNPTARVLQSEPEQPHGAIILKNFTGAINWRFEETIFQRFGKFHYLILTVSGNSDGEVVEFMVSFSEMHP